MPRWPLRTFGQFKFRSLENLIKNYRWFPWEKSTTCKMKRLLNQSVTGAFKFICSFLTFLWNLHTHTTQTGRLFNFSRNKKKDQTAAPVPKLNSQQMHLIPSTRQSSSPAAPAPAVQAGHRPQLVTPTRQATYNNLWWWWWWCCWWTIASRFCFLLLFYLCISTLARSGRLLSLIVIIISLLFPQYFFIYARVLFRNHHHRRRIFWKQSVKELFFSRIRKIRTTTVVSQYKSCNVFAALCEFNWFLIE